MASASIPPAVREVYGPADLSAVPSFAGGFINFGFWDGIPLERPLTVDDRIRSQQAMYRHVLSAHGPAGSVRGRRLLEVGCGLGLGCALLVEEFGVGEVTGMDIHPQQLERARRVNDGLLTAHPGRLRFVRGSAEDMPFADGEFDGVYSVEAAQHFRDLAAFAREAARVVRPGGRTVVTSFFVPPEGPTGAPARLAELLDSFATGLDIAHPIGALTDALARAGLHEVRAATIGPSVWRGLDHWLAGVQLSVTWPRNFLRAYGEGLLDYYTVIADRPATVARPAAG